MTGLEQRLCAKDQNWSGYSSFCEENGLPPKEVESLNKYNDFIAIEKKNDSFISRFNGFYFVSWQTLRGETAQVFTHSRVNASLLASKLTKFHPEIFQLLDGVLVKVV